MRGGRAEAKHESDKEIRRACPGRRGALACPSALRYRRDRVQSTKS